MNNLFMIHAQMIPDNRNQGASIRVRWTNIWAINRADCSLVPALWMCSGSLPMLGASLR